MFKKSNAFFTSIVECVGRLLAPHKMFWSCLFVVWAVTAPVLISIDAAPDWLFTAWIWSMPLLGIYVAANLMGYFGFFSRPEHQRSVEEMQRIRDEYKKGDKAISKEQEEKIRQMDKTRPDRR